MPTWTHLLGLPLEQAVSLLGDAEYRVLETCAPRRDNAPVQASAAGTLRVLRVREEDGAAILTVSRFPDGDPKQP